MKMYINWIENMEINYRFNVTLTYNVMLMIIIICFVTSSKAFKYTHLYTKKKISINSIEWLLFNFDNKSVMSGF